MFETGLVQQRQLPLQVFLAQFVLAFLELLGQLVLPTREPFMIDSGSDFTLVRKKAVHNSCRQLRASSRDRYSVGVQRIQEETFVAVEAIANEVIDNSARRTSLEA